MIRTDRLTKRYGRILALSEVSFEVQAGEILGFLGPNGAGKSTTLRILSGFLPPSSGRASVAGHDLTKDSLAARRVLGYLPENFVAPPELRVGEYLRFRAGLKSMPGRAGRARTVELAEQLGFRDRLRQPFGALSKGFRQRVGLADALLADPPVLLLDEPFGGLDPLQRQEFRAFLRGLAGGEMAILFSSHVLPEVDDVADRILVLHEGTARAAGTPAELRAAAQEAPRLLVAIDGDAAPLAAELGAAFPGVRVERAERGRVELTLSAADEQDAIFRWLAQHTNRVTEFRMLEPSLEELFRRLVEQEVAA